MKKIICVMMALSLAVAVFAQNKESEVNIQKGIEFHDKAYAGDYSNVQKALETLKPYISTSAIACAYYGSTLTLCASECSESNPIKSLDYLDQGGKHLDAAVKMDPKNPVVRLVRLENGVEVSRSSPVKRYSIIGEDIDFLLSDSLTGWNNEKKAEAYLYCGHYKLDAGELDEALDLFDMAVASDEKSVYGKAAQKMLDKYSE